jgi:hypothetical protein
MFGLKAQALNATTFIVVALIRLDYATSCGRYWNKGEEIVVVHNEPELVVMATATPA